MSQWAADVDGAIVSKGAKLTVLSHHHVVRVVTADTLAIETPTGQRFSAQVLDRTASEITLVMGEGRAVSLRMLLDESLHPPGDSPGVFSRQIWLAH